MKNKLLLGLVLILPILSLAQSRFVRVVNTIAELQASNPNQNDTNVFVADTNAGGIFVYLKTNTAPNLPNYPTLYAGATGSYVRVIPILSMLSQPSATNTLQIGQDTNTRLIAFADGPSGISSYELDAGGVARMVLSSGTNLSDNFLQLFDASALSVWKAHYDGSTEMGNAADSRVYHFVDKAGGISAIELDAGGLPRSIFSVGTNSTDNGWYMFDESLNTLFKVDNTGNIANIRGAGYVWPSTNSTAGNLQNDGAGNLSWSTNSFSGGATAYSYSSVGTGTDYEYTGSGGGGGTIYERIVFGTSGPSFTLTNAGTYQIMLRIACQTSGSSFAQDYWLTNVTDNIGMAGSYVSALVSTTTEGVSLPIIMQITTAGPNRTFELYGQTHDLTYTPASVIATNTVLNVLRLY